MADDLDLGVIGNCAFGALIDRSGDVVWCCLPRFDGDPVFCRLLDGAAGDGDGEDGAYTIDLAGFARSEQNYLANTAVLRTRLFGEDGSAVEITDFAPRFFQHGRTYRPTMFIRMVRPIAGIPRVRIAVRPRYDYGTQAPEITHGSNHIRYVGPRFAMRLTTNAPLAYVLDETPFILEEPISFIFGPDETLQRSIAETSRLFLDMTVSYWRDWVRQLTVPLEWQDAVIRAAITLKLSSFEETGAIVAAMTTSIPEVADSGRNWDYRYCWLRDAFFVVRALNRLGAASFLENYLRYLLNILVVADGGALQPVYGIALESRLAEREVASLSGYRGMGPVRVGNQAFEHIQHDTYGHVVCAATQAFFDRRLLRPAGREDFERLEAAGEHAFRLHDAPDAGMWELRTRARVHTSSSVMCWAACDRLAKIAAHLGLDQRSALWRDRADEVRGKVLDRAWNPDRATFVESFDGEDLDAGLLLMSEVGFLKPRDARFISTVAAMEKVLRRGDYLMRYVAADDHGEPQNAFTICTFWYIEVLVGLGRIDEARDIFVRMLESRNHLGLLSEDIDPNSGELWGNFPQTYSLVGVINSAMRLSEGWDTIL